jgi:acyl carrier protein
VETSAEQGDERVADSTAAANALIETLRQLAQELHPARGAIPSSLDARLEQDYGFDSLGRVELFLRVEKRFGVTLPEAVMASVETPRDLLRAIHAAGPAHHAHAGATAVALERATELTAESETPDEAVTLQEVLAWHARRHATRPHIVLQDEDGAERTVTYAELDQAARAVAAGLIERGIEPGRAVAIMLPTSVEYFYSFFGILLAGGIPVDLPARAPLPDRGPPAAPCGNTLQRSHRRAHHRAPGEAARAAPQAPGGLAAPGGDAGRVDAARRGGDDASRQAAGRCDDPVHLGKHR